MRSILFVLIFLVSSIKACVSFVGGKHDKQLKTVKNHHVNPKH